MHRKISRSKMKAVFFSSYAVKQASPHQAFASLHCAKPFVSARVVIHEAIVGRDVGDFFKHVNARLHRQVHLRRALRQVTGPKPESGFSQHQSRRLQEEAEVCAHHRDHRFLVASSEGGPCHVRGLVLLHEGLHHRAR